MFEISDEIMRVFLERYQGKSAAPKPSRPSVLRAVTAENLHEFDQAPKRRGKTRRVRIGGNVVALDSFRGKSPRSAWSLQFDRVARLLATRMTEGDPSPADMAAAERALRSALQETR